jgi:uncharacterized delta-60 repeat protein
MKYFTDLKSSSNQILKTFAAAAVILLVLSVNKISAQLDPTFGTGGVATTDVAADDTPLESFVLPSGKILVVNRAGFSTLNYYFLRYNADGTLDATYGTGGVVQLTIPAGGSGTSVFNKAARQADGKIILAGKDSFDGVVVRYNEDGSLDTSFATGGVDRPNFSPSGDGVNSVLIQPDGKILIGGFTGNGSVYKLFLQRYVSNGTVDPGFGTGGSVIHESISSGVNTMCTRMYLQSTGKILCGSGEFISTNASIRRFNSDGSVDNTFTVIVTWGRNHLQPDDKILIFRNPQKNDNLERGQFDCEILRYNADGTVDTGFGTGGITSFDVTGRFQDDLVNAVQILPDGQILIGMATYIQINRSNTRGTYFSMARLSSSGALNGNVLVTKTAPYTVPDSGSGDLATMFISVLPDGKILTIHRRFNSTASDRDILLTRQTAVPPQTYTFRGVPFDFEFIGSALPTIYRPGERKWYFQGFPLNGYFFGLADDIPVPSDYIKDFRTEMAVFRPSNGTWYIARVFFNASTNFTQIQWGLNGDIPQPADYDSDGKSDVAVFRPSNGTWYIRYADGSYTIRQWGLNGDKPAIGDFDGDGKYDLAVFRPSDGNWYIQRSSDGGYTILHFGLNGDIPVQEDYDGDGKTDIAVWRPSDGVWYRLNSSDGSFFAFQWGISTDIAIPGDYDADLKTDIAVWRPSEGRWYVFQSGTNSMGIFNWGISRDLPVEAKY